MILYLTEPVSIVCASLENLLEKTLTTTTGKVERNYIRIDCDTQKWPN